MPNYVYNKIEFGELTPEREQLLEEVANKGGFKFHYLPMPDELKNSTAPNSDLNKVKYFMEKYGYPSLYEYALDKWGTKWGDMKFHFNKNTNTVTFETAWSPFSEEYMSLIAKDFPDFYFTWEEEEGYGQAFMYNNGEIDSFHSWEIPPFEELSEEELKGKPDWVGSAICKLTHEYQKLGEKYPAGYYELWDIDNYLSSDLDTAIKKLNPLN